MLRPVFYSVFAVSLMFGISFFYDLYEESQLTGARDPYLQMITTEGMTIRWLTEDSQLGVVRFGEQSGDLTTIERERSVTKNHSVRLTNLKPGTQYFYQIGNSSGFIPKLLELYPYVYR